jgi:hypothetical protein
MVTLPGFGGFYVYPEPESWVFKYNPGQWLQALFGWSTTYTGKLKIYSISDQSADERLDEIRDDSYSSFSVRNMTGRSSCCERSRK